MVPLPMLTRFPLASQLLAVLVALASAGTHARAVIIASGDLNVTGGTGTLEITEDIDFPITASGTASILIFDEWSVTDGNSTLLTDNPAASLSYQINGGPVLTTPISQLRDHLNASNGAVTPNDGLLAFSGFSVSVGHTLTIKAQTITFGGSNAFNPAVKQIFSGFVFLTGPSAAQLSEAVDLATVPEPAESAVILGGGLLAFAAWRRRRASPDV